MPMLFADAAATFLVLVLSSEREDLVDISSLSQGPKHPDFDAVEAGSVLTLALSLFSLRTRRLISVLCSSMGLVTMPVRQPIKSIAVFMSADEPPESGSHGRDSTCIGLVWRLSGVSD